MNRFHLGVDYGTSSSKLILRQFEAAGGEKAYLLEPNDRFRISSGISFSENKVIFNSDRDDALVSLKMRHAGEVTGRLEQHFYGDATEIPFEFSAGDLVTLTVWKLISIGHLATVEITGNDDFKMGMTLGVPMSFLDNEKLRSGYLALARTAYHMYSQFGPCGPESLDSGFAKQLLCEARLSIQNKPPVPEVNVRNWIRSETEASMFWSFYSPATRAEQFFCIDIGAGTTDSSAFLIKESYRQDQWEKDEICFFGAHSHPYAMDALRAAPNPDEGFMKIRDGLVRAGQKAYSLVMGNRISVNQWSSPKLVVLGGGSFHKNLCLALTAHPMTNFKGTYLERLGLHVPDDLIRRDGSSVKWEDVAFTSVAYGLAQLGEAVPEAARPTQVQAVQAHSVRSLPSHEEIYGD